MSLTPVQGKLCASASCFIFYIDSLHATWILYQVPPKLLCPSICIEWMVLVTSTLQANHVSDDTCDTLCDLFAYDYY
ncbi:hypothetical protein BHM03_00014657 [Ensete ventricosum]|nr:hypothetical protein BHM03_00014657 [Ensete ventricosum]